MGGHRLCALLQRFGGTKNGRHSALPPIRPAQFRPPLIRIGKLLVWPPNVICAVLEDRKTSLPPKDQITIYKNWCQQIRNVLCSKYDNSNHKVLVANFDHSFICNMPLQILNFPSCIAINFQICFVLTVLLICISGRFPPSFHESFRFHVRSRHSHKRQADLPLQSRQSF